jgi:hypothetical protein
MLSLGSQGEEREGERVGLSIMPFQGREYAMAESHGISLEHFRILVARAGLHLSDAELTALQPMFDFYAEHLQKLHEVELGAEELAVTFLPH